MNKKLFITLMLSLSVITLMAVLTFTNTMSTEDKLLTENVKAIASITRNCPEGYFWDGECCIPESRNGEVLSRDCSGLLLFTFCSRKPGYVQCKHKGNRLWKHEVYLSFWPFFEYPDCPDCPDDDYELAD